MVTETALVKRSGGNFATNTVRTIIDPNASPSERIRAVSVSAAVVGGGFVGADLIASNAGGLIAAVGTAGEAGLIAAGAAAVVGGMGIVSSRLLETESWTESQKQEIRVKTHSVYKRVGVVGLVAGGFAAAVGGIVTAGGDLGVISHMPDVANMALGAAQIGLGAGVVGTGMARQLGKRARVLGPPNLAE